MIGFKLGFGILVLLVSAAATAQTSQASINPTISVQPYIAVSATTTRPTGTGSPITQAGSSLAIPSDNNGGLAFFFGFGAAYNASNNSNGNGNGDSCATYYVWCNVNAHLALSTNTMVFHVTDHTGNTANGTIGWSSTGDPSSGGLNTTFTANKAASPVVLYARFFKNGLSGSTSNWDGNWTNSSSFTISISAP
ncbi:MAG TPA: hypothetical protein VG944_09315 [Fimbriimonas sp.]|nr:hypothetical protein [Fimbriimonas sp.]